MNKFLEKIKTFFKTNGEVITPTVVLAIICVIVTLALSTTNLFTADKIAALAIKTQNEAMSKLIQADEYQESNTKTSYGDVNYNVAIKDGDTIGYIFVTEANGYGGPISVMTAVDMKGNIIAVEILAVSDETPGLGQNVTKENFYTRFNGMSGDIVAQKAGTASKDKNEIDAVTGATISSRAVTKAVNQALDYAEEILVKEES